MSRCAVRHQILAAKKEGTAPPPLPMPDVSNGHVLAIHRLHAADAEDAWLQREWGEIQVAQGNLNQAATHFEVSRPAGLPLSANIQDCILVVMESFWLHSSLGLMTQQHLLHVDGLRGP